MFPYHHDFIFFSPSLTVLGNMAIGSARSIWHLLFSGGAGVFSNISEEDHRGNVVGWFGLTRCPTLLDQWTVRSIRFSRTWKTLLQPCGRGERSIFQVFSFSFLLALECWDYRCAQAFVHPSPVVYQLGFILCPCIFWMQKQCYCLQEVKILGG